MDRAEYVHKRKNRYMAQFLDRFEEECETRLPADVLEKVKVEARRKFTALATDVCELIELKDEAMNGYARDMRDQAEVAAAAPSATREEARR
jgi:Mg-chelatase subunit ChlI